MPKLLIFVLHDLIGHLYVETIPFLTMPTSESLLCVQGRIGTSTCPKPCCSLPIPAPKLAGTALAPPVK